MVGYDLRNVLEDVCMKYVYVCTTGSYSDYTVAAVLSTQKAADEWLEKSQDAWAKYFCQEIDQTSPWYVGGKCFFYVCDGKHVLVQHTDSVKPEHHDRGDYVGGFLYADTVELATERAKFFYKDSLRKGRITCAPCRTASH